MARATNVEGLQTLLRFCAIGKTKQLNYVSTQGVFTERGRQGRHVITEHSPIHQEQHRASQGYVASKW
ncbi:SDR family oxidoreductase, partial [Mesorhizobium japonicum]